MKRGNKLLCLSGTYLVILSFVFNSCSSIKNKSWDEEYIVAEKYSDLADQVNSYLEKQNFQGAVLIGKGKKIIFAKGYGSCDVNAKDLEPIGLNTTFEVGSITKQMTATAIMQLVQKHKLSLDDRLSKFFPEYEHGDEITIRMLLNMRSGLTDHINAADDFFPKNIYRHIEKNQIVNKPLDENIVLTSAETYLRNTLVANGIIKKTEYGYSGDENTGLISLSQESSPYLRGLLLTHEGYHGLFYAAEGLRGLVYNLWDNLLPEAKQMWTDYLRTANAWNYDYENEYLLRNELLGYLMQQKDFGEYFDKIMFPRLLQRNEEAAPDYEADRESARASFVSMAGAIASFLNEKYNLSPGNLSYLRDVR